jgi:hypothetical protein
LDRQAEQRPTIFTYALSEVLVAQWDKLPENWRAAFLDPKVLGMKTRGRICSLALPVVGRPVPKS